MESSSEKTEYLSKCCIEDPKSNVLDLSREPTKIVLRPSMLEEPGEHGKEQAYRKPQMESGVMGKGKQSNEVIGRKKGWR